MIKQLGEEDLYEREEARKEYERELSKEREWAGMDLDTNPSGFINEEK